MKNKISIAVLGDSISQGIGSKQFNYCNQLKKNIEAKADLICEIKNFAYTGTTILYANQIVDQVLRYNPDIVLSFYGNVDAMIRPKITGTPNFYAIIPARYKKNGMLDPRPFFSSSKKRSFFEHLDSFIRYNLKKLLICLQGVNCWVELDEFITEYQRFLDAVLSKKSNVFIVSTVLIDQFYFPGTPQNYRKFNDKLEELASKNDVQYIDVYSKLSDYKWDDVFGNDHFHPSQNGYTILANIFADEILNKAHCIKR